LTPQLLKLSGELVPTKVVMRLNLPNPGVKTL